MSRIKRKPGAQPGNQNARKHGFYSKVLTPEQQRALTCASFPGIDSEIAILRLQIASLVKKDLTNLDPILRTISALRLTVRQRHDILNKRPDGGCSSCPRERIDLKSIITILVESPDLLKKLAEQPVSASLDEGQ